MQIVCGTDVYVGEGFTKGPSSDFSNLDQNAGGCRALRVFKRSEQVLPYLVYHLRGGCSLNRKMNIGERLVGSAPLHSSSSFLV